jgi:hypothetical protein
LRFTVPRFLVVLFFLMPFGTARATGPYDDYLCDIAVTPAATLLLPYFVVDLNPPAADARSTVFNVINVSPQPQIARATIWTDWAYPVLSFNIPLTGYDVEAVDVRDLILRGFRSGPARITNPNHRGNEKLTGVCSNPPPQIPLAVLNDARALLTTGVSTSSQLSCIGADGTQVSMGSKHPTNVAAGFITIDLVANCDLTMPHDARYYEYDLLYDNVLTGDFVHLDPKGKGGYASASPFVHIRAVPAGGPAGAQVATELPYTFYDRFTGNNSTVPRKMDRRQPLPSVFATRWIQGGSTHFQTQVTMWRESVAGSDARCNEYAANATMPVTQIVRFDENENATATAAPAVALAAGSGPVSPAAGMFSTASSMFPALAAHDVGGWFFINLHNGGASSYGAFNSSGQRASQNWISTTLFAEDRYGVEITSATMVNGCVQPLTAGDRVGPR